MSSKMKKRGPEEDKNINLEKRMERLEKMLLERLPVQEENGGHRAKKRKRGKYDSDESLDSADSYGTDVEEEEEDMLVDCLGEKPESAKNKGLNIHSQIQTRWEYILKKGLSKEQKTELINKYPTPENCNSLVAPKINPEISITMREALMKTDNYYLIPPQN
ncbi:unnamed protein product [Brassicogethes aeneus]|uniref:Uncharacterized protein n=1 Tax=Brassicogethes aeneus TaxID=1431903 RepID=A0A9P0FEL7_BRAAE|nr:unnamed protein product [Brassicogethes aeneus]